MAFEVVRHNLPLFDEEGRAAATDDEAGRDRHYLPDFPEEDPYAAGHRTCAGCGPASTLSSPAALSTQRSWRAGPQPAQVRWPAAYGSSSGRSGR